jgi:lysyl-tRNA synthetase class II
MGVKGYTPWAASPSGGERGSPFTTIEDFQTTQKLRISTEHDFLKFFIFSFSNTIGIV